MSFLRRAKPGAITFIHGRIGGAGGEAAASLRIAGGKVAALDCRPEPGDVVVDLHGDAVLPGLINAHDHLELNNFPRLKWRSQYQNAGEWIAEFQPRFKTDPVLVAAMAAPLADRLLLGGIKNLLSGATTVCHHNPYYSRMRACCPVRVVRRYGHSHSLLVDGSKAALSFRKTSADRPWIIHAAEGIDEAASAEFDELDRLGCIGHNTVLVHGIGLTGAQQEILLAKGAGLVWCPSSNDFLFGSALDISRLARARRIAIGTDSRLSGGRDLLQEIGFAARRHGLSAPDLMRMVTADAAALFRLADAGSLNPGVPADLVVLPGGGLLPADGLLTADRSRIRLVMLGGRAQVGDPDMAPLFAASGAEYVEGSLDGRSKLLAKRLAERLRKSSVQEPGLVP